MNRRNFVKSTLSSAVLLPVIPGQLLGSDNAGFDRKNYFPSEQKSLLIDAGLKIVRIETYAKPEVAVVKVTTDTGESGWGQISTYSADIAATVLHRHIARHVLGEDLANLDQIVDNSIERNMKYPWSFVCRALGGVETSIWDLYGKIKGKPVCELLGGSPDPVEVYGSSMSRSIKPEDEAARFLKLRDEKGINAFKFRVGTSGGHNQDAWPGRTEEIIKTVGTALAGSCDLLMDGNSCYTPDKAIEVGRLAEDYGVKQFEEPCPYWELEWTAEVTSALDMDVSGGEQDNDLAQWRRMIKMNAVDIVQPDILYMGGINRTARVAKIAEESGLPCIPHSANHCNVLIYTLHMMQAISNPGKYLEYSIEWEEGINKTARELYSPHPELKDGKISMPPEPGWGVTFNEKWLKTADHHVSEHTE